MSRTTALVTAAGASAAYVVFLGWPAPAARAAALAIVMARCRTRQRHVQPNALLAATCLAVLLVDPWAALDLGGWLSAAALWGASTFTRWSDRALGTGFWARTAASSLGATLATAPITAAFLGHRGARRAGAQLSRDPAGGSGRAGCARQPDPAARLARRGGGAGGRRGPRAPPAGALRRGRRRRFRPAHAWSSRELAELHGPLGGRAGAGALGRRGAEHAAEAGRRLGWCAGAALWLRPACRAAGLRSPDGGGGLALHFLDVGQGDGAVLRTPGGRWIVIDAGPASGRERRRPQGRGPVSRAAGRPRAGRDRRLPRPRRSPGGRARRCSRRFPVGVVIEPGGPVPDPAYAALLSGARSARVSRGTPARSGESASPSMGWASPCCIPRADWPGWGEDVNEDSVVLLVEYGGFQALFTGDAGFPAEAALRGRVRPVDLLKVGHHGSRGSTGGGAARFAPPARGGHLGGPKRLRPSGAGNARPARTRGRCRCSGPTRTARSA